MNGQKVEQTKYPSLVAWMNKMWSVEKTEYYSILRKNESQTHALVRMNLDDIVLSEIRQKLEDKIILAYIRYH
jgi:hypothetical protein